MRVSIWFFPVGGVLTIGGVFLCAALEIHSFNTTLDWLFSVLLAAFPTALLIGMLLTIVGAVLDRRRLPVKQTRVRGFISWAAAVISFLLLRQTGNLHGWTFTWFFPGIAGLIAGAIYLI
jgi:hypothetical protein